MIENTNNILAMICCDRLSTSPHLLSSPLWLEVASGVDWLHDQHLLNKI